MRACSPATSCFSSANVGISDQGLAISRTERTVSTQAIRQDMLFPTKLNPHPPIPSSGDLLRQVVVDPAAIGNFLYGGYMVSEGLRRALDLIGRPLDTFERVLDFGCGSARVLRWFRDLSQTCRFSGTD